MITHISFDMDGTLITLAGMEFKLWYDVVPQLYAEKHKISFSEAYNHCTREYDKVDERNAIWYDPPYWFKKFGFGIDPIEITKRLCSASALVYPDVVQALEKLQKNYKLVLFTNTQRAGLEQKLEATGLGKYFKHTISATSDIGFVKTDVQAYTGLLKYLNLKPENLLHIGDYLHHDYEPARAAGIRSILIDRDGAIEGNYEKITSLHEVEKFL